MKLAKVQAASGLAFTLFLLLHLATTSSAVGGASIYDSVLVWVRSIYRPSLPIELALVGLPLSVHVACAVIAFRRRPRGTAGPWRMRFHRLAGWVLLTGIVSHVAAARLIPALSEAQRQRGGADFNYFAYSVMSWPYFIKPYYLLYGAAGALHLGLGISLALKVLFPSQISTRPALRAGKVSASLMVAVVLVGLLALYAKAADEPRARFPEYRDLYGRYLPFMPVNQRLFTSSR